MRVVIYVAEKSGFLTIYKPLLASNAATRNKIIDSCVSEQIRIKVLFIQRRLIEEQIVFKEKWKNNDNNPYLRNAASKWPQENVLEKLREHNRSYEMACFCPNGIQLQLEDDK